MKLCGFVFMLLSARMDNSTIPVGEGPHALAIADFNHDGKLDIAVANSIGNTVSILLGDGAGHFHSAEGSPFPAGPYPNDLAVADFNGDGHPDLAIPNHATPYVTILLGDGKGAFHPAPHSPFQTESSPHPHGAAAADFNGDGKMDIAIDSWGHNQVLLMQGDGAGGLDLPGRLFNVGKRPYQRLRSADFNHDGKPDLVTTNLNADNATVLLGDGRGGFREAPGSPFPAGAFPWAVAIDDIDKDGNPDLLTIPYTRDIADKARIAVTVLLGDGKGGFRPMAGSPFRLNGCEDTNSVATGDFNGDGRRDIAVACAGTDNVAVLSGMDGGGFRLSLIPSGKQPRAVAVGDFNADGKDDIVVANTGEGTIRIILGRL
jgi:hypothetical protein